MFCPGVGTNNVATHPVKMMDSELLPTLNADSTDLLAILLIDFTIGTEIMPL
jgi:hypothetical protein